jgi:hypothetical protein
MDQELSLPAAAQPHHFVAGLWASMLAVAACLLALLLTLGKLHGAHLAAAVGLHLPATGNWVEFLVYAAAAAGICAVGLWLRLREWKELQALRHG